MYILRVYRKLKKKPTKKENDVFVVPSGYFSVDSKTFFLL